MSKRNLPGTLVSKRAEIELLLCCVRTHTDPAKVDRIGALLREEIDWAYLVQTARNNGTTPLLYWNLNATYAEAVPEDVMAQLREHFHANGRRNLVLAGELLKILDALEERKITTIPYKGPVLAAVAYRNLALREFFDLDLLLEERDVLQAREVLSSLGYRSEDLMTGSKDLMTEAQAVAFLRYERQYEFTRDDGIVIELQWKIVPRYLSFPLDPPHVLRRAERVSLGGRTVKTLSREDLLLTLCVHGSVHSWHRLGWICDVAEVVHVSKGIDWKQLVERADALRCKRMLLLGLFLANDLFGTELADEVLHELQADAMVKVLAGEVREQLFSEAPRPRGILEGSAFQHFQFRMLEQPRDKLRYCVHRMTAPTLLDWKALPLPATLFPCYRLLRPILLTGRFGRRLVKRLV